MHQHLIKKKNHDHLNVTMANKRGGLQAAASHWTQMISYESKLRRPFQSHTYVQRCVSDEDEQGQFCQSKKPLLGHTATMSAYGSDHPKK